MTQKSIMKDSGNEFKYSFLDLSITLSPSEALDKLHQEYIKQTGKIRKKEQHIYTLDLILANAKYKTHLAIPSKHEALKKIGLSKDITKHIKDFLIDNDYIELFQKGSSLSGHPNLYSIKPKLEELCKRLTIVSNKAASPDLDSIVLKSIDKASSPEIYIHTYKELELDINTARTNLEKINTAICSHSLTLHNDILPTVLKRVFHFHDNSLYHGRFYAGYQQINRKLRKDFLIDNHKTAIIDFKSMSVRMLYAYHNLPLEKDPYLISDINLDRNQVKELFLHCLNISSKPRLMQKVLDVYRQPVEEAINSILTHHASLGDHIVKPYKHSHKNLSGHLGMYLESQLIEKILLKGIEQGIILYPIHDAFICKQSDLDEAIDMINCQYNEHYPNSRQNDDNSYPLLEIE